VFLTDERGVCYVDMNMVIYVIFSVMCDSFQWHNKYYLFQGLGKYSVLHKSYQTLKLNH